MADCSLPDQTLPEEDLSGVHPSAPDRPSPSSNRRWWVGLGAAGLLLAVGIPLVQSRLVAQETESAETDAVNVLAVETLTADVVSGYDVTRAYTGEIAALRSSDLGFTRGGELVQVLVAEGDRPATSFWPTRMWPTSTGL